MVDSQYLKGPGNKINKETITPYTLYTLLSFLYYSIYYSTIVITSYFQFYFKFYRNYCLLCLHTYILLKVSTLERNKRLFTLFIKNFSCEVNLLVSNKLKFFLVNNEVFLYFDALLFSRATLGQLKLI